jgi:hypothetical protein
MYKLNKLGIINFSYTNFPGKIFWNIYIWEKYIYFKKGGVRIFQLVEDWSPIYHQVRSPKLDYVSQFEFD